jgi:hypothetical protein
MSSSNGDAKAAASHSETRRERRRRSRRDSSSSSASTLGAGLGGCYCIIIKLFFSIFTATYIVYGFAYFMGNAIHIPTGKYSVYGSVMNLCLIETARDLSLRYTVCHSDASYSLFPWLNVTYARRYSEFPLLAYAVSITSQNGPRTRDPCQ